jgi:3-dehydroquinate dehydratase/shikimate dehydrogenase
MTELCVTVTGRAVDDIRRARDLAEPDADLVELRLDSMEAPDPIGALAGRRKPAIVTCRPRREGGMFDGSEEERLAILRRAHEAGAEYIDVEWDADARALIDARGGRGVIVSKHDFSGTPAAPGDVLAGLRASGGEVVKLAVMTNSLSDLERLTASAVSGDPSIVIGMGAAGLPTRILAARLHSRWTYAGDSVAPGQLAASRLLHEFRFRRIRPDTAVYVLLGTPIAHSLSPAMHNAGFAALGLNAAYVPIDVPGIAEFRQFARAMGVRGASVTIPFKRDAYDLADDLAGIARAAGAVNTLMLRDGRWLGANTDAHGFLEPLRRRIATLSGLRVIVLGAGGAARAVVFALGGLGVRVAIAARRSDAAQTLASEMGVDIAPWPPAPRSWDVLVNATPAGSSAQPDLPVDVRLDGRVVYDLVYEPETTALLERAAAAGLTTIGGLEMLIAQAERQFELWTGERPPAGLFLEAASQARAARTDNT